MYSYVLSLVDDRGIFSVSYMHARKKENPTSPNRSQTYDLPITINSSDAALPLSYRTLMGSATEL